MIESPRGKLLLHEYETLADGRLKIKPCTMIFLHEGEAENEADRNRRAVILQAPEGAILRFDTPVDLRQSKMGKLIGANMMGPITIRSDQRLPGPQDDLLDQDARRRINRRQDRHAASGRFPIGAESW